MKWCCCSRYATGITLGSLYIVGSILVLIFEIILFLEYDNRVSDPERRDDLKFDAIKAMILCGISALVSSLFIVAIAKRLHYLIIPWLIFGMFVFYITCCVMYLWFIGAAMGGAFGIVFLILLLITVLSFGIEIGIYCFSWSLFKQIRNENIEKSERVDHQLNYKALI